MTSVSKTFALRAPELCAEVIVHAPHARLVVARLDPLSYGELELGVC